MLNIYVFMLFTVNSASDQSIKSNTGKKGRTWGPSSVHQKDKERRRTKNRERNYSDVNGRASSFPNLGVLDRSLINGSSSDIRMFILSQFLF